MDDDDILGGLNDMMELADKPDVVKKATRKAKPEAQTQPVAVQPDNLSPLSQQIIVRLDEIQAQMLVVLAEKQGQAAPVSEKPISGKKPEPAKKPKPESSIAPGNYTAHPLSGPAAALIVVVGMLLFFAMGMGYGAIVATHHFPVWFHKGLPGALTDWVAAPAGILLFPVISGLFFRAGHELHTEQEDKAAMLFYGLAVVALIAAIGLPLAVA